MIWREGYWSGYDIFLNLGIVTNISYVLHLQAGSSSLAPLGRYSPKIMVNLKMRSTIRTWEELGSRNGKGIFFCSIFHCSLTHPTSTSVLLYVWSGGGQSLWGQCSPLGEKRHHDWSTHQGHMMCRGAVPQRKAAVHYPWKEMILLSVPGLGWEQRLSFTTLGRILSMLAAALQPVMLKHFSEDINSFFVNSLFIFFSHATCLVGS